MSPKLYRTIVIDPAARSIEEVQSAGTSSDIRLLVRASALDHFRLADHGDSWDYGWCDMVGLAREQAVYAFLFSLRADPVAGRCVLQGVNKDGGATCDTKFPLGVLRQEVTWLGLIQPKVTWIETEDGFSSVVSFQRVS